MKPYYWFVLILMISSCLTNKNWITKESNIKEGLHDLELINEAIAIAYSYGTGNLYKTVNAGDNWENIYQFDSIYFEQIQFLDENNGWIVGSPNKIYRTQDGGKNWIEKSLIKASTNSLIYGMWFDNKETGYISALERVNNKFITKILKTENGGSSWNLVHQIDEMILNLERIDNMLYGTGNNIIIKQVDSEEWRSIFRDTTKKVGQIRDIEQNKAGKIYASSFNGFIIEVTKHGTEKNKLQKIELEV